MRWASLCVAAAALLLAVGGEATAQIVSKSCSCLRGKCTCDESSLHGPGAVETSALSEAAGSRLTTERLGGTARFVPEPGLKGFSLARGSTETEPQGRILKMDISDKRLPLGKKQQVQGPSLKPQRALDLEEDLALMVDSVMLTEEGLLPSKAQRIQKVRAAMLDHQQHKALSKLTKDALLRLKSQ